MDEAALIEALRGILVRSEPSDKDEPLRVGIEIEESGARCVVSLPPGTVEARTDETVDIDLLLRGEILQDFAQHRLDGAQLARAIEARELRLRGDVQPKQLLRLLAVIDSFVPSPEEQGIEDDNDT